MKNQGLWKQTTLSKIRSVLWPIYGRENKKLIPMGLLMICILFMYTLFRDMKDSLIQYIAVGGGTPMLSALKTWFVMPISLAAMAIFMKLSNKFSNAKMFYGVIIFYLSYFALFGFVLFPNAEYLHGSPEIVASLREKFPHFYWIIPCVTNWSFSIFYLLSELWAGLVIGFLFWQFANEITKSTEAPRFYGMFGFLSNLGLIASGLLVDTISKRAMAVGSSDVVAFGWSLKWQMGVNVVVGIITMAIYAWMQKQVIPDPKLVPLSCRTKMEGKPKMGAWESIVYVVKNPYIMLIACLVLGYEIANTLNEHLVKTQFKAFESSCSSYNGSMGRLTVVTGLLTMVLMLIETNILKRVKWRTAALLPPIVMGGAFLAFFGFLLYQQRFGNTAVIWGIPVLNAVVLVGKYQLVSNKIMKYSLFDATKNMACLPLDSESKLKGQAAVEIVGSRLGKAGGSAIIWFVTSVLPFGKYSSNPINMWIISITCFVALALWTKAIVKINPKVITKMKEKEKQEALNAPKNDKYFP
ncbi:ADP,ATP carrier protein 1 [Clostridia bacterium]|nr:ADP,ATP carrier protein 1 [Clostridia bacterium]